MPQSGANLRRVGDFVGFNTKLERKQKGARGVVGCKAFSSVQIEDWGAGLFYPTGHGKGCVMYLPRRPTKAFSQNSAINFVNYWLSYSRDWLFGSCG